MARLLAYLAFYAGSVRRGREAMRIPSLVGVFSFSQRRWSQQQDNVEQQLILGSLEVRIPATNSS